MAPELDRSGALDWVNRKALPNEVDAEVAQLTGLGKGGMLGGNPNMEHDSPDESVSKAEAEREALKSFEEKKSRAEEISARLKCFRVSSAFPVSILLLFDSFLFSTTSDNDDDFSLQPAEARTYSLTTSL